MTMLQVYGDRLSQPFRAVFIFCKVNAIDFEEVKVEIAKNQQLSPEFKEINPLGKLPAIVHGTFKLSESHTILAYLASAYPGVPDHWYPADLQRRAKIQSVLDWHHSNLRQGALGYVLDAALAPLLRNRALDPVKAAAAEKVLVSSLEIIESVWLNGEGRFLLGGSQPSIADLSLVCEITELEVLDKKDYDRILGPHTKVQQWIESTRNATQPHFDEVHEAIMKVKVELQAQRSVTGEISFPQEI